MSLTSLTHQVRFPTLRRGAQSGPGMVRGMLDGGWTGSASMTTATSTRSPGSTSTCSTSGCSASRPTVVSELLAEAVTEAGEDPAALPVLDLGAGNGMVGEALRDRGFEEIVGVDIIPEAGEAVERDRPGVYAEYHVCDMLDPPDDVREALRSALRRDDLGRGARLRRRPARGVHRRLRPRRGRRLGRLHDQGGLPRRRTTTAASRADRRHAGQRRDRGARPAPLPPPARRPRRPAVLRRDRRRQAIETTSSVRVPLGVGISTTSPARAPTSAWPTGDSTRAARRAASASTAETSV